MRTAITRAAAHRSATTLGCARRLPRALVLALVPPLALVLPLALAVLSLSSDANAAPEKRHPIQLRLDAPRGCPTRQELLAEVDSLLGGRPAGDETRMLVDAQIRHGSRWILEMTLRGENGEGERKVVGSSCAELTSVAALIVALAFDREAVVKTRNKNAQTEPADNAAPPSKKPTNNDTSKPTNGDSANSGDATDDSKNPAPTTPPAAAGLPEFRSRKQPQPPNTKRPEVVAPEDDDVPKSRRPTSAAKDGDAATTGETAEPSAPAPIWWSLGLHAGLDTGTTPTPALSLGGQFGLRRHPFVARVVGTYLVGGRRTLAARPSIGGEFDLWSVAPQVCITPWRRVTRAGSRNSGDVMLDGCVGTEFGELRGRGFGVRNPGEGSALWLAPTLGAQLEFTVTEWLSGRAELGVALPVRRHNFVLEQVGVVHLASAVSGRAGLGLAVVF